MSNSPLIDDNEVLSLLRHSKIKAAQYIRNTAGLSLTDCVAYIDKLRASRENSTKGKQTVEEAARDFAGSEFTHEDGPFSTFVPLQTGFNAGAAGQKEQGIDWIDNGFPPKQENISVDVLFYAGNYSIHYGYYNFKESVWFSYTLNSIIRIPVTHWAYINIPKTT